MHPLYIIAKREFVQRVRQKSFWIMLLLGPFFLILIMVVPIGLTMQKETSSEMLYLDKTGKLDEYLYSEPEFNLIKANGQISDCLKKVKREGYSALIVIDEKNNKWQCKYYQTGISGPSLSLLKAILQRRIIEFELTDKQNISLPLIEFQNVSLSEFQKDEPNQTIGFIAGLFAAIIILVFINQYSHMVLRGVVEEKQNRISELILTSIKPVYFISGKILGIASVAFLQIFVWFALSGIVTMSVKKYFNIDRFSKQNIAKTLESAKDISQSLEMNSIINSIESINTWSLLLGFIFYFVFGYLLFSSLFAIVGIAVGSDTDAQQMAIPFTLPLSIPIILLQYIIDNQGSGLTLFLSLFPFTSPTTMLLRLPFGVPYWQFIASGCILILTLILSSYSASKIYKTGILMYGKKFSLKEVIHWARQA
ncbi:MAG: ABC transporter permease [Opitutaceae bacterium]|nr:ABC transporter permease [Cytophagales bacterium]